MKYILDGFLNIIGILIPGILIGYFLWSIGLTPKAIRLQIKYNRRSVRSNKQYFWSKNKLLKRYNRLLSATIQKYSEKYFINVLILQVSIIIMIFISVYFVTKGIEFSFFTAILFGLILPYSVLRMRLGRTQSSAQANISFVVIKLLQSYRKEYRNINYALMDLIDYLKGPTKVIFGQYFMRITSDISDIEKASEILAVQIGNDFGNRLAILIQRSVIDGIDIEVNLSDLSEDISEFQKRVRESKTEGMEASVLGYLPIIATPVLMIIFAHIIPNGKAMYYYFQTSLGLKTFIISVAASLIGFFFAIIFSKPKQSL